MSLEANCLKRQIPKERSVMMLSYATGVNIWGWVFKSFDIKDDIDGSLFKNQPNPTRRICADGSCRLFAAAAKVLTKQLAAEQKVKAAVREKNLAKPTITFADWLACQIQLRWTMDCPSLRGLWCQNKSKLLNRFYLALDLLASIHILLHYRQGEYLKFTPQMLV